ncbi:MAG: TolC family protein [Deltaproteobacteria bacterium]|nr:TolC family protein [Deltaproteobacteria bacterium]
MTAARSSSLVALALGLSLGPTLASSARAAEPTPRAPCTLAACVADALAHAPEIRAQAAARDAAIAQHKQARGNLGPRLIVDGGVQIWDDALEVSFGGVPGLPIEIPPFVAREQVTWSLNLTIAQPLAGLWTIFEANELAALGVDVAELDREAAQRESALVTAEAWLQARLARDLVVVSQASVTARQSDRERAGALVKAGVLVEADLARADLGVMQARQALSQAERRLALAHARLGQLVGRAVTPEGGAEGADPTARPLPVATLEAAKARALERRLEVTQVRTRIQQASVAVGLARSKMAPEVNLVAQAQFTGGSEFQSESAAFVGLTLKWEAWSWGSTWYGIDEAEANLRRAREGLRQLEDGLGLEVEAAWVDHEAAVDQATLAAEAERVAGIHYELTQKRLAARAATTFDVVSAESELTQARQNVNVARASALMARARLARAMGSTADEIASEATP